MRRSWTFKGRHSAISFVVDAGLNLGPMTPILQPHSVLSSLCFPSCVQKITIRQYQRTQNNFRQVADMHIEYNILC